MQIKKQYKVPVPDVYFGEDETRADFKEQNKVPVPKVYFEQDEKRADYGLRTNEKKINQAHRMSEDEIVSE